MKIAHICHFRTPSPQPPTVHALLSELAHLGHEVIAFSRSMGPKLKSPYEVVQVEDRFPDAIRMRQIPKSLHRSVLESQPDVIWMQSLNYPRALAHLARDHGRLFAQHHGERPLRGMGRWIQKLAFNRAAGFLFCGAQNGAEWMEAHLVTRSQIHEVHEGSTLFQLVAPEQKEHKTIAWIGHLNPNKDPLFVLNGLEPFLTEDPRLRLVMAFGQAPLMPKVQEWISHHPNIAKQIDLLGSIPPDHVEQFLNRARYFVSASHRESTGYALCEAIACGATPIVTDIPSHRYLVQECGFLYKPGDIDMFRDALSCALNQPIQPPLLRQHFEAHLSYPAIAKRLSDIFANA
ncbi:MAG: glycosyltransferase family 4 protein [Acidobacteria bacterium]|nr:glycosyltransferase family 4 protein [Acidobacteriota bacterium]